MATWTSDLIQSQQIRTALSLDTTVYIGRRVWGRNFWEVLSVWILFYYFSNDCLRAVDNLDSGSTNLYSYQTILFPQYRGVCRCTVLWCFAGVSRMCLFLAFIDPALNEDWCWIASLGIPRVTLLLSSTHTDAHTNSYRLRTLWLPVS